MTRWLSGIALVVCGLLSVTGQAQDSWPQSGFPSTGYIGAPGSGPSQQNVWGEGGYYGGGSDPYAQLRPGQGYESDRRLGALLGGPVRESWVRFDVLHWSIKGADETLLGAPVAPDTVGTPYDLSGQDRSRRLQALDRITGARPQTFGVVPTLGQSEESGIVGFRGSFGIPTVIGDFEANGFVFEEHNETVKVTPFTDSFAFQNLSLIGAVTMTNDGVIVNDTMILFSEGLKAAHNVDFYGFETNLVNLPFTPNSSLLIRPIVGFRYLNLRDQLTISGQDVPDPLNDPTNVLNHYISSRSQNHVFGPQIGFRAESQMAQRFTLGTDFKLLFGINRIQNRVNTEQIFTMTELPQEDTTEVTRFAPVVDFSVYGRLKAHEYVNLMISYQLLVGDGFSRSYDTINYDASSSVTDPPQIRSKNSLDTFYAHGLVLGVEIVFP